MLQQAERGERTSEKPACGEDRRIIMMSASWKRLFLQILLLVISCRHVNTKTPGPTPPPLVPTDALPTDGRRVVLEGESQTEKVELSHRVILTLECAWTCSPKKLPNIIGFWRKDGAEIENSRLTVQLENGQYELRRVFKIVSEENLGNYSCVFGSEAKTVFVLTAPQVSEEHDKSVVSYLGDTAVLPCKMDEKKPKPSKWIWYKANGTDKEEIFNSTDPHRYKIKNENWKTKLWVHNLTYADSGLYYCGAVYNIGISMGRVKLKVITIYEPLKPFIAIVVEVIVLVAAILLCEKSRSKKKSTEGNEPNEQTNTLTHGENNGSEGGSSMRQRKV